MADEEVRLTASMNDDLSAALERIERRLEQVERQLVETAAAGKALGRSVDEGAKDAEDAVEDLGDEADRTKAKVKGLGDEAGRTSTKAKDLGDEADRTRVKTKKLGEETEKAGRKAGSAGAGFDKLGTKLRKTRRNAAGFASILTAFKIGGVVTGVFALAGGVSALGAGAAIAVGGLAPMVGVLGLLPPLFLAAKLATWAFKLAAEQLSGPLTRIKDQFGALGQEIADGGLAQGMDYLASSMFGLSRVTGKGLAQIGGVIGDGARGLGDWISSAPFLEQVSRIFAGLAPIIRSVIQGLLALGPALLGYLEASLPVVQEMADLFRDASIGFAAWLKVQNESGRTTAFLNKAWTIFTRTMGVLVDIVIGTYNVLRIGARYADEMGMSIEDAAYRFRLWSGSAEGQARINRYFLDSLPALREMGKLLAMVVGGFAGLSANQDIAPLLSQIRTELAPAFGELLDNLAGQGGLGPALITATAAVLRFFAGLDFSGLTTFIVAVGELATGIAWIAQNVPGANFVISALLASMLGFKLLGPVFAVVGNGAKAFGWVWAAAQGTKNLSKAQQMFKGVLWLVSGAIKGIGTAFRAMAVAGIGALRALSLALFTTPVGWIILAIMAVIAVIILLWTKCEWFRDAVTAAWEWIKNAAVVAWEWIVNAVSVSIDAVSSFVSGMVDWVVNAWRWISESATNAWNWIVSAVESAISAIGAAANWLWTNVIEPVWNVIATVWEIQWAVIAFVVQTVIYIIVGIIAFLAWMFEAAWKDISNKAKYAFENVILPVVRFFQSVWESITSWVGQKWTELTTLLGVAWNYFYTTYIEPVVIAFRVGWAMLTSWVSEKWTWLTDMLAVAWNVFYAIYVKPVIDNISAAWEWLTTTASVAWTLLTSYLSEKWNSFRDTVSGAVDWISQRWGEFTAWLAEVFEPVGNFMTNMWEGIQRIATNAAEIVKGAWNTVADAVKGVWNFIADGWNSIPAITVPEWVPGIGGKEFSLPKLPMLWKGGETPGGPAIVGEHGPEPLVRGGRVVGMLGMNGPEVANLPKGGYVVPNLKTLAGMPGLAKRLPSSVAAAVAASVPGYSAVDRGGDSRELLAAVRELTAAVREQRPPVTVTGGGDIEARVASALRTLRREDETRRAYSYRGGRG